jgi:hypothetical protein
MLVQTLGIRLPYVREFHPGTPEANIRDLPFVRPQHDAPEVGTEVSVVYRASLSARAETVALGTVRLPTDCTLLDAITHYFLTLCAPTLAIVSCY